MVPTRSQLIRSLQLKIFKVILVLQKFYEYLFTIRWVNPNVRNGQAPSFPFQDSCSSSWTSLVQPAPYVLQGPIWDSTILKRIIEDPLIAVCYSLALFFSFNIFLTSKNSIVLSVKVLFLAPKGPTIGSQNFYLLDRHNHTHLFWIRQGLLGSF